MATWHQHRNPSALRSLWSPDPTEWKVVNDRANQPASAMSFSSLEAASDYVKTAGGGVVIPPKGESRES